MGSISRHVRLALSEEKTDLLCPDLGVGSLIIDVSMGESGDWVFALGDLEVSLVVIGSFFAGCLF